MEHRINRIHEKALKLIYNDTAKLSFEGELVKRDKSVSIHQRNLQLLATKIFLVKNRTTSELLKNFLQLFKKPYNLRNTSILHRKSTKSLYNVS